MKLADGRVYCLPDGYEVLDRSLDDIRHVLDPRFGADALAAVDTSRAWSSALDGSEYLPGVVGLNNVKATDYVNVVLQALMRVKPLRDAMLRRVVAAGGPTRDSPVLQRFGELTRKVWNPRNFKGQVRGALVPRVAWGARLQARTSSLRSVSVTVATRRSARTSSCRPWFAPATSASSSTARATRWSSWLGFCTSYTGALKAVRCRIAAA
jgi:hypothetical protein